MDLGYDAFLSREAADHDAWQQERDARDAERRDLITDRAIDLGADAVRFMRWINERGIPLADVEIKSNDGKCIDALTALISHAPTWIREIAVRALIDQDEFEARTVRYSTGHSAPLDVALVSHAPAWLRCELVDWLSRDSMLADEVETELREVTV